MTRRLLLLLALSAIVLPACATRHGRAVGYAVGSLAAFTGVVLTAGVVMTPTPCDDTPEGMELDPFCIGPVFEDMARVTPPLMVATTGLAILAASAIASYLYRNVPEDQPRHRRRYRREDLRREAR